MNYFKQLCRQCVYSVFYILHFACLEHNPVKPITILPIEQKQKIENERVQFSQNHLAGLWLRKNLSTGPVQVQDNAPFTGETPGSCVGTNL